MPLIGAQALPKLSKKDFRILIGIELGMKNNQYVEVEEISRYANLSIKEINRILQKCHKLKLIHRWTGHFIGYELTIHGYDALALNALYTGNIIRGLGREKGVGKESKVYYALTPKEEEVVLKLHRVGYASFHQVKKKRSYTANKHHISELYASRLSAESEKKWLEISNRLNLIVPKIIASNRHILVMQLIDGMDLVKVNKLPNPIKILEILLDFIDDAWNKGKFVHGDLSEHNIIITEELNPVVIDFPQAVSNSFEDAENYLKRDIYNILTYFKRKHGIGFDDEAIFNKVISNGELPQSSNL